MNSQQPTNIAVRSTKHAARFSRIVFTLNNWTPSEYESIKAFKCKWMVIAKEHAPVTLTPHLQGAIVFNVRLPLSTIKKTLSNRAHIENMMGTPEESLQYCSKEDLSPFTKGELPKPGKRNDVAMAVEQIKTGRSMRDLAEEDDNFCIAFVKYNKGLTALKSILQPSRTAPPVVIWIHGETGTGKTECSRRLCSDVYFGEEPWMSAGSLQWFDGYDGQSSAILDDFRTNHCSFSFLLRLLDRYPLRVPFKGGFVNWNPKLIFVTAPYQPKDMFNLKREGDINQLCRRITHIVASSEDTHKEIFVLLKSIRDAELLAEPEALIEAMPSEDDSPEITQHQPSLACSEDSLSEESFETLFHRARSEDAIVRMLEECSLDFSDEDSFIRSTF